jgi:outer membrane protein TolC
MFREVPKDRLVEVYASEEFWNRERKAVEQVLAGTKVQPEILADFVFEYVSDTKTPQGILCLVRQKQYSITEIVKEKGGELPLLLVLDQIQDPGNLGTIVRTAEGAGVTGIVMSQDSDVDKMITEGVATKADGLSVKVKVNEAEMKLTQIDNGLSLSKMVLCQLCGLPLNDEIRLADEDVESLTLLEYHVGDNVATALANREELRSLDLANKIYDQKVNITRAGFLPTVALTANYMVTNPSLVNGFERKFRGMWAVGAMVQIPIWNWGEGMYKVKAAKAEANIARYQLADAKEKVELQVSQASYKVNEAAKRLSMAEKNLEKADENLRYAKLGFMEGVIPTSNVLEAQTAWLSAQSDKIDAQIDVKLTEVYLRKSMGVLK